MVDPSLDCWQSDVSKGGEVKFMSTNEEDDIVTGKTRRPQNTDTNLFPDLLDLASTQPGYNGDADTPDLSEQLRRAKKRINELECEVREQDARVRALDSKIATMERMLGAKTSSLFIGFNNVLVAKDTEIERLNARVR
ncbi:hypothetical protein HYC85_025544 [Camellia sinensis]|uniref:Uncharacterized protein n=1 Tax=Camellia sinensis TaxID=4442 RepID=A0A7J7GF43_CAMSI|nr:hypothetical protein HYC85_025544 [Camellia sinensis]